MKLNYSLFLAIILIATSAFTIQSCVMDANASPSKENLTPKTWTNVENAVKLAKTDQKKILVDVYTDWCKWCKVMDEKTFSNPEVSAFLANNYHLAKFNAEQKEVLQFNGKKFSFKKNGKRGYHEFALDILNGQLAYPSLVVFDSDLNKLEVIRGFKNAADLMNILQQK